MTALPRLARILRFALADLSSQNAHHEFEHLCRHIAKQRIASNVIPATGPVSAGGDQGRDFETFRTYLHDELPFSIGFLALAVEDTVVFACTLQHVGLTTKIRADMATICSQGSPVDRIVIFCVHNISAATRHRLQTEARADHRVELDILDGEAIAELLADPDLFWIAEEYLHLPAELQPPIPSDEPALPEWYIELRSRWQARGVVPFSSGDLAELTRGLRHAMSQAEARDDLSGWILLIEQLAEHASSLENSLRAHYEIAVATLRATSNLRPAEGHVRGFFAEITSTDIPTLLLDASVLLQYCEVACGRGVTTLTLKQTAIWTAALRRHVGDLLEQQPLPNTRALLLEVAAHLALHFDFGDTEETRQDASAGLENSSELALAEDYRTMPGVPSDIIFVDVDEGMKYLEDLIEILPQAPLFPVDTLAVLLDMLTPALIDHALYPAVRDGLDSATARQSGDASVADHCRRRAMALLETGRLLDALRQFHDAKVNWWHGDTLSGSLLAMLLIANIYSRLRMPLAGKKYALAAAIGALRAPDPDLRALVPHALFTAASYDHQAGAWVTSAETTAVAALAQVNYVAEPWDSDRYPYIQSAVAHQGFTILAAQQHRRDLVQPLQEILDSAGFGELIEFAVTTVAGQPAWSEEEWLDAGPDMTAPPFCDAGRERQIRFVALGLSWTVRCSNEQPVALAAESFSAAVQVLLVDLAVRQPLFLPGHIDIEVRVSGVGGERISACRGESNMPSNTSWIVYMSGASVEDSDQQNVELLATLVEILIVNSLLPMEQFMAMLESAFQDGLTHKVEVGRPYQELANLRGPTYRSPACGAWIDMLGIAVPFPDRCAPELKPASRPGPGYTTEKAAEMVRTRYERLPPMMRYSLPHLLADERLCTILADLRRGGWKDWHLLTALVNLVINARVAAIPGSSLKSAESFRARGIVELNRLEEQTDPLIAIDTVTREALENALSMSAIATLQNWGLELHRSDVDPAFILEILGDYYGYWTEDVDHEEIFSLPM